MPGKALETFGFALRGIGFFMESLNAWVLLAGSLAALAAGFYFSISALEWCAVVLALAGVWVAEALNTAIERVVDLASPGMHPLAGRAKDIAAGAVLMASLAAVSIGAIIFVPRLF